MRKKRIGRRLLSVSRLALVCRLPINVRMQRCIETMTLPQLEDSSRPLLFSLLPRMLRRDGSTPTLLSGLVRSNDSGPDRAPALIVSSERWSRALATSRKFAARRQARRGHR